MGSLRMHCLIQNELSIKPLCTQQTQNKCRHHTISTIYMCTSSLMSGKTSMLCNLHPIRHFPHSKLRASMFLVIISDLCKLAGIPTYLLCPICFLAIKVAKIRKLVILGLFGALCWHLLALLFPHQICWHLRQIFCGTAAQKIPKQHSKRGKLLWPSVCRTAFICLFVLSM